MLILKNKINILTNLLEDENSGYADTFNEDILLFSENCDFNFLHKFNSEKEIKKWLDLTKHKMVMHEHEDGISNIFEHCLP